MLVDFAGRLTIWVLFAIVGLLTEILCFGLLD